MPYASLPRRKRHPKPNRVRALELLASSRDGCSEAIMRAHGFAISDVVLLVHAGLATAERVVAPPLGLDQGNEQHLISIAFGSPSEARDPRLASQPSAPARLGAAAVLNSQEEKKRQRNRNNHNKVAPDFLRVFL
jgi:hypothetical protein